jgi:hypothetical protein
VTSLHVADPGTRDWIIVGGPIPILTILITYPYFCISAGSRWMKDRIPFDFKYVVMVYNTMQAVFSMWFVNKVRHCSLASLPPN